LKTTARQEFDLITPDTGRIRKAVLLQVIKIPPSGSFILIRSIKVIAWLRER
jgi:hypothetical protein